LKKARRELQNSQQIINRIDKRSKTLEEYYNHCQFSNNHKNTNSEKETLSKRKKIFFEEIKDLESKKIPVRKFITNFKGSLCVPWKFSLRPLTRETIKSVTTFGRWSKKWKLPYGVHEVAPKRHSIQVFNMKFWILRNLMQIVSIVSETPSLYKSEVKFALRTYLKYIRPKVESVKVDSTETRLYYLLRQANRYSKK